MAGIYLHIPFCKKACHYCDFHFSTSQRGREDLLDGMLMEMKRRASELQGQVVNTIYFGGGTPSLLSYDELMRFFEEMYSLFDVDPQAEITMEANFRDDLKADSLDLVELIMAFEEEFGGEISDDEAQAIKSVGDAVTYLEKRGE